MFKAARRRRAAYLPRYLPEITLMLLEALGAGEPDLEELLDALEELHVVGAVVLGVRHPLVDVFTRNCKAARNSCFLWFTSLYLSLPLSLLPLSLSQLTIALISCRSTSRMREYTERKFPNTTPGDARL